MKSPAKNKFNLTTKAFALPYSAWIIIFTAAPMILVFFYAFTTPQPESLFTWQNILKALSPLYISVFFRSVGYAALATLLCLLIGYPTAYFLSQLKSGFAGIIIMLFILPMWMNFLLRTYAWRALLDNNGIINQIITGFGFEAVQFLYTGSAILFGLVYNFLPFMVLPIYTVLQKTDPSYKIAAQDLGANRVQTFFKVTLPLSKGGVVSGITMVFMPAMTTFVITRLLGGGQFMMYGDLIELEFLQMSQWNVGSALSIIMLLLTIVFMWAMRKYDKYGDGAGLM